MNSLQSLWDSGILGGLATTIVTVLGQLSAQNSQKFMTVLETLQKQQASDIAAHDAAFARAGDGGVWMRRVMLLGAFAILGFCPFVFAFFHDIPVAVETVEQSGGWRQEIQHSLCRQVYSNSQHDKPERKDRKNRRQPGAGARRPAI